MELPETTTKPDISLDTAVIYPSTVVSPSPPSGENIAVPSNDSQKSLYLTPTTATEPQLFESNPIEAPSSEFIEKEVLTKQTPQNQVTEDTLTNPSDIQTPQEEISSSNKLSDTDEKDIWTGTVDEVENMFVTKLIDGIDTILIRDSNKRYSGKMRILDASGEITGELHLLDGRMNGEELYYESGKLVEKNLWENGQFIKNLPVK
jgi:antitoxin component YwqK of YwqJK toxin-antitoxin module